MSEQDELEGLGAVWQAGAPAMPGDLGRRVRSQTARMAIHAAAEVLLGAAFFGGFLWRAITRPAPEYVVLAIAVWMITLAALISSANLRSGTWRAAGQDTRAYLALCLRRCRAGLKAIRLGFWLLGVEVALLAGWHGWFWSTRGLAPAPTTWLAAALVPAAFLVALLVVRRRRLSELARLESLDREFAG